MKYTCKYYSGGDTEYDGGIWEKKETPKTIRFTLIEEPFFDLNWNDLIIKKDITKNTRHCLRDWKDGTFTIYPDRCGTPYVFEPLTKTNE
jgi:hypothetical protein